MKGGNTKYRKNYNSNSPKSLIVFSIVYLIIFSLWFLHINNNNRLAKIIFYSIFLTLIVFSGIGTILGVIKGKLQIAKENKYIKKTNPYIYYRELPNNFGIGITSLLFDSTIENYKDIVAVILDLCAKKYIKLMKQNDKYIIDILKPVDDDLLNNEKYILTLIEENNIKNINYKDWYNYCMQDGIDLGLYTQREISINNDEPPLTQDKINKNRKIHLKISYISGILIFLLTMFKENTIKAFVNGISGFILIYIVLIIPFYLINVFTAFKNIGKKMGEVNYKNIMESNLQKTEKGINELHKLYSFKAFINDFGNFVDKKPDEVVLWDRYLSYAQVFGLTKKIMKSGYKELVDNSSFRIDNIENINFNNIEINQT